MGTLIVKPKNISLGYENTVPFSEDFTQLWYGSGISGGIIPTLTPNIEIAPDGKMTASKLVCETTGGTSISFIQWNPLEETLVQGDPYTGSFWAKAADVPSIGKTLYISHVSRGAPSLHTLTSSWVRYSSVQNANVTRRNFMSIGLRPSLGSSDGIVSFYLWGTQIHSGTILKPYQKTNGTPNIP